MNQRLNDLFQKKQEEAGANAGVNWDIRRKEYLDAVQRLYAQIEAILSEPIGRKSVALHRRPKQLTESYIGTYSAEDLILVAGGEQVRFSPRGRNIVGAAGRVNVVGERSEAALILQPDSQWAFVQSRQPTLRVVPFDDSTLGEVLQLVMRN